jgi:hypothetical protein
MSQAVYSIRQDVTYKILTEAVIQDPVTKEIVYNLAQQDMVALRVVMRLGWEIPNPINALQPDASVRFPFAILDATPAPTTVTTTVTVQNTATTPAPIAGATVIFGGMRKKTGTNGQATFSTPANTSVLIQARADGYNNIEKEFAIGSAAAGMTISLTKVVG